MTDRIFTFIEANDRTTPEQKTQIIQSIVHALRDGYRLIDTAKAYNTEQYVGEAIRQSGVPRESLTIVTKLYNSDHNNVQQAFDEQLAALGLEYIDIYLMHWPCAGKGSDGEYLGPEDSPTYVETWKEMENLLGPKLRGIGVSNFSQKTLDGLLKEANVVPVVNQVEVHVQHPSFKLVEYCQRHDIQVMGWAPLAGGPKSHYTNIDNIYSDLTIQSIASKHQTSIGVILISWLVDRNVIAIPHSASHERLSQNIRLVTLSPEETDELDTAHEKLGKVRLIEHLDLFWKDGKLFNWSKVDFGWEDESGNWLL